MACAVTWLTEGRFRGQPIRAWHGGLSSEQVIYLRADTRLCPAQLVFTLCSGQSLQRTKHVLGAAVKAQILGPVKSGVCVCTVCVCVCACMFRELHSSVSYLTRD